MQHPQLRAASDQTGAAQAQLEAASGRYFGNATVSAGWHRYEGQRVVGVYTPGQPGLPLTSDAIGQAGVNYSLPVDVFGVIAANRERAKQDLASAELLARQQTLLKLHQAGSDYFGLQALLSQKEALALYRRRVEATYARISKEVELGKAAGVDASYAASEVMRLAADETALQGAISQTQADLQEASGVENFLPKSTALALPDWDETAPEQTLPAQLAQTRADAARAQANENRRALYPSVSLDANYFRNQGNGDNRDTWAVGGVVSLPLGISAYKQSQAQNLNAQAAAEQKQAALRDSACQLASLKSAYQSARADMAAMEKEIAYREQIVAVQREMQRLGNQTLENLFRHERDLLDARYRLALSRARAAAAWSSAQVLAGMAPENYIARWEPK
ncbi:TolC family protein [Sulfurimicrobium lacus]|uniref:TolC family protein n=1 Tax=Sulfurimicrobium lacus TaxID=2715678 RepID=UPI003140B2AA